MLHTRQSCSESTEKAHIMLGALAVKLATHESCICHLLVTWDEFLYELYRMHTVS